MESLSPIFILPSVFLSSSFFPPASDPEPGVCVHGWGRHPQRDIEVSHAAQRQRVALRPGRDQRETRSNQSRLAAVGGQAFPRPNVCDHGVLTPDSRG